MKKNRQRVLFFEPIPKLAHPPTDSSPNCPIPENGPGNGNEIKYDYF